MKFDIPVGKILSGVSPSMRREWIEMPQRVALPTRHLSPSMRREWIEIFHGYAVRNDLESPSMRREWIEMKTKSRNFWKAVVSLHAEGVD